MVQSNLKSDNFCGFNQAAAPMYWVLDPVQNELQYTVGEVGIYGGVGLHTPGEVIDVSSSIVGGGRDNYLTSCIPPVPALMSDKGNASDDSIRETGVPLPIQGLNKPSSITEHVQGAKFVRKENFDNFENIERMENTDSQTVHNKINRESQEKQLKQRNYSGLSKADGTIEPSVVDRTGFLQPEYTAVKRSAKDYSSINWQGGFSGNEGNLYTNPQNLTYVIERMWLERGGLDQNQLIKQSREKFVPNTGKGPLGRGEQTCEKIRQPYNIKYPFGLPTNQQGDEIPAKQSQHFDALDVASVGISSPVLEQDNRVPFNYNAMYSNGGCNDVSFIKNKMMCLN